MRRLECWLGARDLARLEQVSLGFKQGTAVWTLVCRRMQMCMISCTAGVPHKDRQMHICCCEEVASWIYDLLQEALDNVLSGKPEFDNVPRLGMPMVSHQQLCQWVRKMYANDIEKLRMNPQLCNRLHFRRHPLNPSWIVNRSVRRMSYLALKKLRYHGVKATLRYLRDVGTLCKDVVFGYKDHWLRGYGPDVTCEPGRSVAIIAHSVTASAFFHLCVDGSFPGLSAHDENDAGILHRIKKFPLIKNSQDISDCTDEPLPQGFVLRGC